MGSTRLYWDVIGFTGLYRCILGCRGSPGDPCEPGGPGGEGGPGIPVDLGGHGSGWSG